MKVNETRTSASAAPDARTAPTSLAEQLDELVTSGLSQEEALARLVAQVREPQGNLRRRRGKKALWSSPAGAAPTIDRVTHELVRADFERKCADLHIPPWEYRAWMPAVEMDRFSAEDRKKKHNESGVIQAAHNVDWMIEHKCQPIGTVSEYSTSAYKLDEDRPEFFAFWDEVRAGKHPRLRVISRRHSRLTRRHEVADMLKALLLDLNGSGFDIDIVFTDTPDAPATGTFVSNYEYHLKKFIEAELSSTRTRDGILDNFEPRAGQGEVLTGAYARAFGFDVGEDGSVCLCEEEANWTREAFERLLAGELLYPIWSDLTERGMVGREVKLRDGRVRPAGPITFSSWVRMLCAPRWCGHRYFIADRSMRDSQTATGELIPVNIPAVIDRRRWEDVILPILKGRSRPQTGKTHHELSGILFCPCGSHMIGTGDYYVCAAKARAAYDPAITTAAGAVHTTGPTAILARAAQAVLYAIVDDEKLAACGAIQLHHETVVEFERERGRILAHLAEIDTKLKRLAIKVDGGFYDENPRAAQGDRDKLMREKQELALQLDALRAAEQPRERLDPTLLREVWPDATGLERRQLYGEVIERVDVAPSPRTGRFVRHEERLRFTFKPGYEPPAEELAALLARLADERIAAQKAEQALAGSDAFEERAVELHEAGLPNSIAAERLAAEFETSPRGKRITGTLVWDTLHRYYTARGELYLANPDRRPRVSLAAQKRLVTLRTAGHIWREIAAMLEDATKHDQELAHPSGPWTWQRARSSYELYVQADETPEQHRRRGLLPDEVLARLDVMQRRGQTYKQLASYVTSLGRYVTGWGNTTWNPGTVFHQLRTYRLRMAAELPAAA